MTRAWTVDALNALTEDEFVEVVGPVFEHSDWIARETWPYRPFFSRQHLLAQLAKTMRAASSDRQLGLIRAHPDLAGRLSRQGELTAASAGEQASAGLDHLTAEEGRRFDEQNARYQARFGFPFVICARLADKAKILDAFQTRLLLSPEAEQRTALEEIEKIAALRLDQLLPDSP